MSSGLVAIPGRANVPLGADYPDIGALILACFAGMYRQRRPAIKGVDRSMWTGIIGPGASLIAREKYRDLLTRVNPVHCPLSVSGVFFALRHGECMLTYMARDIEHQHQVALFNWARYQTRRYPELDVLFAIPNGGARDKRTGGRLKAEGVKAGVSDIMLPVARHGFHGLWIELKAPDGSVQENQKDWAEKMTAQGYKAVICWSWTEARDCLVEYLT